jgi:hypothetical protein
MIFGLRGETNHVLLYSLFCSFLENLDIDEFNKFWDIVHLGMIKKNYFS